MARKGFFTGSRLVRPTTRRTVAACGQCGLHKSCNLKRMPVIGTGKRRVLFVSETPSTCEDEGNGGWSSKSGKFLRRTLGNLGFDLDSDAWGTWAVICKTPAARRPKVPEIKACAPNLLKAIRTLNPDVIIPLGSSAVRAVIGPLWKRDTGEIEKWAGWQIPCTELGAWVCPTWAPIALMRESNPVLDRQFKVHLRAAIAHEEAPGHVGPATTRSAVHCEPDVGKAARWLRKCCQQRSGAIAWDYETNCLKPDAAEAKIVSCSVAWGRTNVERCIAFPWHGEVIPAMSALLRSDLPKIASNLKFEDRWTHAKLGHGVKNWAWDTMIAAHVCDNRPGITSVKFQAFVRLGTAVWNDKVSPFLKSAPGRKLNRIFEEIDLMDLLLYNGLDSVEEFRVACAQIEELGAVRPWNT